MLFSFEKKKNVQYNAFFFQTNNSITFCLWRENIFLRVERKYICACAEKISFFVWRKIIFLRGTFNKIVFWGNFRSIMQVSVFSFVKIIHSVFKTKNLFVRKGERFSNGEATLRLFCKFFPLEPKSCANSFRYFNLGFLLFFNRRVN